MVKKALLGVTALILGVLILFDNMEMFNFSLSFFKIWPILLILFGIGEIIDAKKLNITSAILLVIGTYFLLYNYSIIELSFSKVIVPLILIMIGLSLLFPIKANKSAIKSGKNDITITSIFADVSNRNETKKFNKANVTAIFGGATLDLRDIEPDNGKCICISTVVFAGIDIIISDDWNINTDGLTCIFGGVDDVKKDSKKKSNNTLYLTGTVIFGGIEIKNK